MNGLRRFPRRPFVGDVYILDGVGRGFVLESEDLSRGGVFIKTSLFIDEGTSCYLRFDVGDGRVVSARGHVVRAHAAGYDQADGMAVSFDAMDPESWLILTSVTKPSRLRKVPVEVKRPQRELARVLS